MHPLLRRAWNRLRGSLASRRLRRVGLLAGLGYALAYLYSVGHLVVAPGAVPLPGQGPFVFVGWENLWRARAPYNFEPVAVLQPGEGFALLLALPNLLLAASLGLLLALNVTTVVHLVTRARHCGLGKSASGLLASAPAFLTGFACCSPTALAFLLGAVSAAAFVGLLQVLMPAAFAALLGALAWNLLRRLPSPPEPVTAVSAKA